jgi:hypothetical protein
LVIVENKNNKSSVLSGLAPPPPNVVIYAIYYGLAVLYHIVSRISYIDSKIRLSFIDVERFTTSIEMLVQIGFFFHR